MGAYDAFAFGGRLFGYILCPNQSSTNRAIIERYMAAKAGISL